MRPLELLKATKMLWGLTPLLVRMDCGPRSLNSRPGGSNLALVESQIWMQTR
jgi:hypothetical protein